MSFCQCETTKKRKIKSKWPVPQFLFHTFFYATRILLFELATPQLAFFSFSYCLHFTTVYSSTNPICTSSLLYICLQQNRLPLDAKAAAAAAAEAFMYKANWLTSFPFICNGCYNFIHLYILLYKDIFFICFVFALLCSELLLATVHTLHSLLCQRVQ